MQSLKTVVYKRVPRRCPACQSAPRVIRQGMVSVRCSNRECTRSQYPSTLGLWGTREVIDIPGTVRLWATYVGGAVVFAGFIAVWWYLIVIWMIVSGG